MSFVFSESQKKGFGSFKKFIVWKLKESMHRVLNSTRNSASVYVTWHTFWVVDELQILGHFI